MLSRTMEDHITLGAHKIELDRSALPFLKLESAHILGPFPTPEPRVGRVIPLRS